MTSGKKIGLALGVVAALGLAGVAAFYSVRGDAGNGSCSAASAAVARMKPLVKGEVAAVELRTRPQPAPALAFTGPDGQPTTLAALKGKTLLVNLWATWCAPCLKEMPSLDALQKEMGGPDFAVVAINIDTRNLDKPKTWLADNRIAALPFYAEGGLQARLVAGSAFGAKADVPVFSPLFYVHWELAAGVKAGLPAEYPERAAYVAKGSVEVGGQVLRTGQMAVFAPGETVTFEALEPSTVMLLGGEPVGERFLEWNFVASSKDRLAQAKADWRAGRMKLPDLDNGEFIPLPEEPPPPPPNPMS